MRSWLTLGCLRNLPDTFRGQDKFEVHILPIHGVRKLVAAADHVVYPPSILGYMFIGTSDGELVSVIVIRFQNRYIDVFIGANKHNRRHTNCP
jgi:hypothetical protein